ncbi:MAG: hypothetical protein LAT82_02525 [Nanoarchaeota archaeon]|nr:hypothetical protein [Nanoarchaeota archaeon]
MEDFISKKQHVVNRFNSYISQEIELEEFIDNINSFLQDYDLIQIDLFKSIFNEIVEYHQELSLKDIKQRKLMIESYIY